MAERSVRIDSGNFFRHVAAVFNSGIRGDGTENAVQLPEQGHVKKITDPEAVRQATTLYKTKNQVE